jgi:hypothetical protein
MVEPDGSVLVLELRACSEAFRPERFSERDRPWCASVGALRTALSWWISIDLKQLREAQLASI